MSRLSSRYHRYHDEVARSRAFTTTLIVVLSLAVLVLIAAAWIAVPILTHESAGESGQRIPSDFVSQSEATGEDGRTRTLSATTPAGEPAELDSISEGENIVIHGSGFNAGIGIYVSVCAIPAVGEKPEPCLGGIPEGAEAGTVDGSEPLTSAWVTNDWAWRLFATHPWEDPESGTFTVELTMPPAADENLDCTVSRCAIVTRADHTAGSDRVQDMLLPIAFA